MIVNLLVFRARYWLTMPSGYSITHANLPGSNIL